MDFLKDFGVQPILLAAQVVNFLILLYLLKRFLYKPILKVLEERKKTIAQSLKNADEIERRLIALAEEEEKRILKSSEEGVKIIKQAEEVSTQIIEDAKVKAQDLAQGIVKEARSQLQVEKQQIQQDIREHLSEFIVLGLQKVTGKKLTEKEKKELVEQSVKDLK